MTGAGSICLVLGAGGVRGFAHLGVLERLQREGIAVDSIVGCSVGGLVGAYHAALGEPLETMIGIGRSMTATALLSHAWSHWSRRPDRARTGLAGHLLAPLATASFLRLRGGVRHLGITAFDLIRRRVLVFHGGGEHACVSVAEAAIGGSAIPVLFPPKRVRRAGCSYRLVDAGFLDAVPIESALGAPFRADTVVAVDLSIRLGLRQSRSRYWRDLRNRLGERLIVLRPRVKRFGTVLFLRREADAIVEAGRAAVTAEIIARLRRHTGGGCVLDKQEPNH